MHIPFAASERSTIGVEWELALVDQDSGDLRQVAQTVLDAVAPGNGEDHPHIKQELLLNTVEVVTGVCRTVREATDNLQRLQEVARLSGGKVPSASELATAEATLARAKAAQASSEAGVADARAALSADATNLRKAAIKSPIDGVVLSRNVDPGNAVAASLQAVTLFTIAEDLTRMKLEVNVDEADVGMVRDGQRATFTVSAYPSRNYPAQVERVSYGSTIKDNVVTYQADLIVDNRDLTLRPGMSATASILATERRDVLLVPNAALRFTPETVAQGPNDASSGGLAARLLPRFPRGATQRRAENHLARAEQRVTALVADLDDAGAALAVVLGYTAEDRVLAVAEERVTADLESSEQVAVERAVANSKELRVLESRLQAKELELKEYKNARWPVVDLVAQYNLFAQYNFRDYFGGRFQRNNGQLGASITIPLLVGSATRAYLSQTESDIAKIHAQLNQTRGRISIDARRSFTNVRKADTSRNVARLDLDVAREQVNVLLAQQSEGRASLKDVEAARILESDKWIAYYEAQHTLDRVKLELLRQTGTLVAILTADPGR